MKNQLTRPSTLKLLSWVLPFITLILFASIEQPDPNDYRACGSSSSGLWGLVFSGYKCYQPTVVNYYIFAACVATALATLYVWFYRIRAAYREIHGKMTPKTIHPDPKKPTSWHYKD